MGQMLLAVAMALLLVQGIGAALLYRAQSERREAALLHAAAFRLLGEMRRNADHEGPRFRERRRDRSRGFRVQTVAAPPLRQGEERDLASEEELASILIDQGVRADAVIVTRRRVEDDPAALARAQDRAELLGRDRHRVDGELLIAGVRLGGDDRWIVARVRRPRDHGEVLLTLIWQTLLIYLVVVGALALILKRITRPLAALTGRLEHFAATRDADGQLAPQGPDDVRRLIVAQNAMEARISALLDEKDVMLGAIGHDLKTPLTALRVRIESVENETEREKMAATIEDIVRTLDDILSLARVGRPSDPEERTELSALVAAVVEEYEDMGEPVELGDTERIVLPLRATWLRRAMRNLIGNALRYGRRARVSLSRTDAGAVIRIQDDGPGIPESEIQRMMDPFTRGEPSRNTETGGAGLGLALARAIADQHGGSLELSNRRNSEGRIEGLTARLRLPLN